MVRPPIPSTLIDVIRSSELQFESDARHAYSNDVLLGLILEDVVGQAYEALVRCLFGEDAGSNRTY